jgi:mRNA interferase MazF
VQVVPITGQVDRLYPAEAFITVKRKKRKAMADQMTTASKLRLRQRLGVLDASDMAAVERAIRIQLGL